MTKNLTTLKPSYPTLSKGCSVINFNSTSPQQLIATRPSDTYITHTAAEFDAIKPTLQDRLRDGQMFVVATSYEWGLAQLGLPTTSAPAIFMAYDSFEFRALPPAVSAAPPIDIQRSPVWSEDAFASAIKRAQTAIKEGDIYQINLSYPSTITGNVTISELFEFMMAEHAPHHGAYIHAGPWQIASCSPEEFFYYENQTIRTRPIKGTIGRDANPIQDQLAYDTLKSSIKDQAELTMITDLMRNDLSRIAEPQSVHTPRMCDIVPFNYVYHLESTVEATPKPDLTPLDMLQQLAPGGSITGCPKHSACHHIQAIEDGPREFYTGHIGFMHGTKQAAFNVAIRTCYQFNDGPIMTHSGCGITIDSDPAQEFIESCDKLNFLKAAIHAH